jgi:hypothetical protein
VPLAAPMLLLKGTGTSSCPSHVPWPPKMKAQVPVFDAAALHSGTEPDLREDIA